MKRTFFLVSVALATLVLQGCMALPLLGVASIAGNAALAGAVTKSAAEKKADKCFAIEVKADEAKLTPAEKRRNLTAADCPSS